jgi:hypothetical protein
LEIPNLGVWDVERIETLAEAGLSTEGRKALQIDVHNLLDELALVASLPDLSTDKRFETLEKRLLELEWRL